jgi:hypothetical protein
MNVPLNMEPVPAMAGGAVTMVHGTTRRFRFQVLDRSTQLPADLTGWTLFHFLAKHNMTDTDAAAVINKSLGAGITAVSLPQGLLEVQILPADTTGWVNVDARLFAEIQGQDGSGLLWSLWQGELDVLPTVVEGA